MFLYTHTCRELIADHCLYLVIGGCGSGSFTSARGGNYPVPFGPTPIFHHGEGRDSPNPATGLRQPQGSKGS